jgi:hypothetical protein
VEIFCVINHINKGIYIGAFAKINIIMSMQERINSYYYHVYSTISVEDKIKTHEKFEFSGFTLLKKIPTDAKILDVGCGYNIFKPYFPNLVGIDPVTTQADLQITLEEFNTTDLYDVILCLGSIQQGDIDYIKTQVQKLSSLLKPNGKIFWRTNLLARGTIRKESKVLTSDGFIWTPETHKTLCEQFGFVLADIQYDSYDRSRPDATRLYAEWVKN